MSSGTLTASTSTVGSSTKPVYLNAGVLTAHSSTIGGTATPVYVSSGALTACSSTVGSSTLPVYLNSGTLTACSTSLAVSITGNAATATKLGSSTVGSSTQPIYLSSGTATASTSTVGSSTTPAYMSSGAMTECSGVVVTTSSQTFSGAKTFSSSITATGRITSNSGIYDGSYRCFSYNNYPTGTSIEWSSGAGITIGYNAASSYVTNVTIGRSAKTAGGSAVALGISTSASSDYAVAIGPYASCSTSNRITLGSSSYCSSIYAASSSLWTSSDERDKADIEDFDDDKALEFITALRTVSYVRNPRDSYSYDIMEEESATATLSTDGTEEEHEYSELHDESCECRKKYEIGLYDHEAHAAGTKKSSRRRAGFLAQDIQTQLENVFGSADVVDIVNDSLHNKIESGEEIPDGVESRLEVSYMNIIPFLCAAMRAQQKQIEALQAKLETTES